MANIATRPCMISASRLRLISLRVIPSRENPIGSKYPVGARAPGRPKQGRASLGIQPLMGVGATTTGSASISSMTIGAASIWSSAEDRSAVAPTSAESGAKAVAVATVHERIASFIMMENISWVLL